MELKKGFKRTEGGIIPTDWNDFIIGDLIFFQGGSQPDKNTFISSEKPGYIRLIQIRDYKTDKYKTYIPFGLARRFCEIDDIMIGRYGPPIFQILKGIKGAYNVALIKAIPQYPLDKIYAYYFLKQEKLFSFVEKLSQRSSGQTGVDLKELKNYPLPLPPTTTEQTAIANALSDTDALIQSLTRFIAKKHQIKQGAMQTLLNPYENGRLKAGWVVKKLGEICDVRDGTHDSPQYLDSGVKFVTSKNIVNSKLDLSEISYISQIDADEINKRSKVNCGDVLMSMIGTIGNAVLVDHEPDYCIKNIALLKSKSVNAKFLIQYIGSSEFQALLNESLDGGIQKFVSLGKLRTLLIRIPFDKCEQTRIATILSDMDAEIAALETKLAKYQQIKQGMMQNLLTGRIRLVKPESKTGAIA